MSPLYIDRSPAVRWKYMHRITPPFKNLRSYRQSNSGFLAKTGSKQLPKILASWLFQSLGKKVFKSTEEGWKKAEKKKKISFFLCLSYFVFDFGGGSLASYSREYSWKLLRKTRGTEKAVVSPSFPTTAPSTDHTSLSLASPCFLDVPTICESETDNETTGTQARLTLESKAFFTFAPVIHSLLGWWQTNGAYPRSDLVGRTCLLKMKN